MGFISAGFYIKSAIMFQCDWSRITYEAQQEGIDVMKKQAVSIVVGGDYSKLFLARVVLYVLRHKKTENNFLKIKFLRLTPATRGLKNWKNPL